MLVVRVYGLRQNFYVSSLYCNPDQDDRIYDSLLTSMAAMQAEDVRASFLFVGDLNGHHQEWLGSKQRLPAAEPHSKAGLLFLSQYLSGTIWLTQYSMVWDWRVSRAGPMPFVGLVTLSFCVFNYFPFLFFSSIGW